MKTANIQKEKKKHEDLMLQCSLSHTGNMFLKGSLSFDFK